MTAIQLPPSTLSVGGCAPLAGHDGGLTSLSSNSSVPATQLPPSTLSVGGCAPLAGHDGLTSLSSNSSVPATQLPPSTLSVGGCAPVAAGHEHLASLPSSSSLPSSQCHHSLCYDAHSEQYDVQPDDFRVDGESRPLSPNVVKTPKSKNLAVKHNRNRGIAYIMEKSNKCVPSKHGKLGESNCCFCKFQGRDCPKISTEQRHQIREAYYNMADLQKQREWIIRQVVVNQVSDLKRNYSYYLPQITNEGQKWKVCRQMFTSTIGVSVCQVRTALSKIDQFDVLEGEKRGGQQMVEKDQTKREQVKAHINKFPRMESHYCRANSKCQYLSPDLNFSIMYKMYLKDHPNGASMTFYKKVFKSFNLKFHHAKKDMCGLCETFHHASAEHKKELQQQYDRHVLEKEKSRELKNIAKEKATIDNKYLAAVFDLQQVIYLPKSDRSELFYKRRLSCFNFTIFELASKDGFCFVSHEGRTGRGSCEIASFLHRYLSTVDEQGCETVELYSDGCIGQNKNSIIPAMILYFVERSISVQQVTLNFFETNHGQSEGDAMHSTIERQMRQIGEMFVPSQLVTLIKMARKNPRPYRVTSVESSDILDWKTYSQSRGLLCVRSSEAGTKVDWKKFMQIRVNKEDSNTIKFKYSHDDDDFEILRIDGRRRHSTDQAQLAEPLQCYPLGAHSIPKAKYDDLISLCTGQTPVVSHPDYQAFYRQLSH